jgi:hypothetical protein
MDYLDELDDTAIQALAELGVPTEGPQISHPDVNASITNTPPMSRRRRAQPNYLLRLDHPLTTPRDVAHHLGLSRVSMLEFGETEDGTSYFCHLEQSAFDALDAWTAKYYPGTRWTKILLNRAHMNIPLPQLGRDGTLPHHRPFASVSSKESFPVDYFSYGTLASPDRLARLFGTEINKIAELKPVICLDGKIRVWADRYRALVDCPGARVEGHVYSVKSVEEEETLRAYEGDSYEVVNARVEIEGEVKGCRTFRFAGHEDELED